MVLWNALPSEIPKLWNLFRAATFFIIHIAADIYVVSMYLLTYYFLHSQSILANLFNVFILTKTTNHGD